ncbi:oxygenase MpaB family protein, partial [Mycobacteroides abscessus]|uniref:oxygenase MpaB family protein n=1 Tax=Mycobacteroides abscessus TaxID=36809 RepID=UPI00163AE0A5
MPATLAEMVRYYDDVAENKLADNEFLQWAYRRFDSLPIPSLVFPARIHPMMQPLWQAITQIAVRPIAVCSAGAAHPKMRELLDIEWTRRDRAEYTIYLVILRALWRWAPRRVVLEPLAHNRYRYEKIRGIYSSVLLESFGPTTTE